MPSLNQNLIPYHPKILKHEQIYQLIIIQCDYLLGILSNHLYTARLYEDDSL